MALAGAMLTLSGCGKLKDSSLANNATTTSTAKKKSYQTTNTGKNGYTVLMKNGRYVISPIAGLTATNNDNSVDTRELERGLIQISKNQLFGRNCRAGLFNRFRFKVSIRRNEFGIGNEFC